MTDDIEPGDLHPADLVAYLHPHGHYRREHTVAAALQIRELLRYLATAADPDNAHRAFGHPNVVNDVVLALRDGMRDAAQMFSHLVERQETFADSPRLYAVPGAEPHPGGGAYYVEQSALHLSGVACRCDELAADLDTAASAGVMFSVRSAP